ncbi:MAG: hypothetical protein AUI10_04460 [Actinobacteria bacterium 13_2_20CM_2_72_6]|nr:MAG: hypothetical protein AUI10_04460 [Actinobacteria bacterium 13_2_20CM_2_72_6]
MFLGLWEDNPPRSCLNLIHGYAAQIRAVLEPDRAACLVDEFGVCGVTSDRIDTAQRAGPGLVRLAHCDDLAVSGFEPEPVLAVAVLVQLELAGHRRLHGARSVLANEGQLLYDEEINRAGDRPDRGRGVGDTTFAVRFGANFAYRLGLALWAAALVYSLLCAALDLRVPRSTLVAQLVMAPVLLAA